ncbi:MAG: type II toxin-antitoxin system RelE/ParE family toxin [Bacteroidota bacterium]
MALKIKWTKRASKTFHNTVEFIEEKWSERSAKKFVIKINCFLILLKNQPEMGKIEVDDKGIRGFVISRQTTVFYRIKKDTIILLKFFDNRQNPKKMLK